MRKITYQPMLLLLLCLQACSNGTEDESNTNKDSLATRISINNSQSVVAENFDLAVSCSGRDCARLYYEVNGAGEQNYQQNTTINISNYNEKILHLRVLAKTSNDVQSAEVKKDFYVDKDAPVSTIDIDGGKYAVAPSLDLSCDDYSDYNVPLNGIAQCKQIWASLSDGNYTLIKTYNENGVASLNNNVPTPNNGDKLYFYSVDYLGNKEPIRNTRPFYIDSLFGQVNNTRRSTLSNGVRIAWDAPVDTRYSEFRVCRSSVSRSDLCADADVVAQGKALFADDTSAVLGDVYYQIFTRMPAGAWLTPPRENGPQTMPGISHLTLLTSYQQVQLQWTNPSTANIDFVKIFRKTPADPDPSFSGGGLPDLNYEIKHFDYTTAGALVPLQGSYSDTTLLVEGQQYYYAVYVEYSGTNYSQPQVETTTQPLIMKIIDTSPAASETGVARNLAQVSLSTSDPLDKSLSTLSPLALRLSYGMGTPYVDTAITAIYDANADNRLVFGIPRLALNADYQLHFDADIRSLQNAPLEQAHQYDWGFTSADGVWGSAHALLFTPVTDLQHPLQAQVDKNEHVVVVWQQNTTPSVIVAREGSAGVEWKQDVATVISNASYASLAPKFVMNSNGQAVAAWIQQQTGMPDSLYVRRYLPGTGWDSAGAYLIQQAPALIQTAIGASSDFNVDDFALDINEDGDVFVLWDVKDDLGNGDLSLNHFNFDSPNLINTYTVMQQSTQHTFSELHMLLQNRSASLPATGTAHCVWVDSGSGSEQLTRYSIRFATDGSAIASAPQALPSVHPDVAAPVTARVSMEHNGSKDIALSWVETYNASATTGVVEYDVVASRYLQSSGTWSVPVNLANLAAMPNTRLATAIAANADVLVVWGDANGSQANYLSYYNSAIQAWEANPSATAAGNYAFPVSNQQLEQISAQIDEAGNATIVAATATGVYALRKPHNLSLQAWTSSGNVPFTALFNNGPGYVSGPIRMVHNRLGETLAFWVDGTSPGFIYPGFNLFR